MTWNLGKDTRFAYSSVQCHRPCRQQEIKKSAVSMGLHSIQTQLPFQNHPPKTSQGIQKTGPNTTPKQPQRPSETQKSFRRCQDEKNTNFWWPGPPSRAPKGPQRGPPNGTKSTKSQGLCQKNMICGVRLEATEAAFGW